MAVKARSDTVTLIRVNDGQKGIQGNPGINGKDGKNFNWNLLIDTKAFGRSNASAGQTGYLSNFSGLLGEEYKGFVSRSVTSYFQPVCEYKVNDCKPGETYTASFWARGSGALTCFFYGPTGYIYVARVEASTGASSVSRDGHIDITVSDTWTRYWVKFTLADTAGSTNTKSFLIRNDASGTYSVCGVKLERGSVATDWCPAQEDLKGDKGDKGDTGAQGPRGPSGTSSFLHIAYANSNDGQIGFSHTWSKSKTWIGHYVTDTNEADSDDPTKYTWIKWVGDDGIGITDIIEYYNVNNSATTAPTSWSTTVQQPNATNRYLWNYEEIKFSSGESHKSKPRVIGVYSNSITKITPYYYLSNSHDTFTLVNGHSWTTTIPNISDGEYLWEKMIVTFDNGSTKETEPVLHGEYNALSEGMNIISSNVDSQIDNAQDHILQQVYSTYATKDALNEYKSSMNTQFGIYDGKISANISELNSVKSNVADLTETANNVNNYMTFDKNGLSLGKSDSDFKTNITNEKLAFLQNGNEVAYFANNQMYVTDGNFANSMTIGKFAFVPRANGSLDFKKVGK